MNTTPPGWQPHQPHAEPGAGSVPAARLETKEKRIKLIGTCIFFMILTALAVWAMIPKADFTVSGRDHVYGVIGFLMFGVGAAICAARIVKPAILVADEHGMHETAWPRKNRTIRWDEVAQFYVVDAPRDKTGLSWKAPRVVCIDLTSSGMHHSHFGVVSSGDAYLRAEYLVSADQLADQLEQLRLRYTASR